MSETDPVSRRDFLNWGLYVPMLAAKSVAAWRKETILVIGAGMSGLAAARELSAWGYPVTVLEARDRIGGRVFTSEQFGYPIDLGASWIEGSEDNPLTSLAENHEVEIRKDDKVWVYYDIEGTEITAELSDTNKDLRESLIDSTEEGVEQAVKTALDSEGVPVEYLYAYYAHLEGDSGADVEDWSLVEWNRDTYFEGDDYLFPEGYGQLVQPLAEGLDIRLGQAVSGITQRENKVQVQTEGGEIFEAQRVIVTLPLGVLKANKVHFDPALPEAKRAAIEVLGAGLLDKVIVEFPEVFWPADITHFGYASAHRGHFPHTLNGNVIAGRPYLISFVAGSGARKMESKSDEEIMSQLLEIYGRMFGREIPPPVQYLVTRWDTDPWARGAYSFQPVGVTDQARLDLAEPFDKVHFAGEATIPEQAATVHGAYLSGQRAAAEVYKL